MKKRILALLGTLLALAIFTAVAYAESPAEETGNLTVNYKVVDEQGNLVDAIEDSQQFLITSTTKSPYLKGDDVLLKTNTLYDFKLAPRGYGTFLVGGNSGGYHSATIYSLPADTYDFYLPPRQGVLHASDADYIIDSMQLFINHVEATKTTESSEWDVPVTISSGETVIDIILHVTKPEQVTSTTVKFNLPAVDNLTAEDNYTITLKGISENNADVVRTVVATEEDLANGVISMSDVPPGYYEICESALPRDGLVLIPMRIFSRSTGYVPACSAGTSFYLYPTYGSGDKRYPRIVISIYGLDYSELLNYEPVVKSETSNWSATFTFYWHYPESDGARCGELYNVGSNGPMTDNCTVVFPEVPGFTMADAPTQSHTTSENENRDMFFAMHYVKDTDSTTTPSPTPGDEPSSKPGDEPSSKPGDEPSSKPSDEPSSAPGTEATPAPTSVPSAEPTPAPTSTPSVEPIPTSTPTSAPGTEPTPAPSAEAAAPVSTPAPASTTAPIPNTTVRSTPAPSTKPTPSPTPTAEPTATPAPTAEPEPSVTPDTAPSSAPAEQPEATPAPAEVKKESKHGMPFWVVPVAVPCVAAGGASFITIFRRRWRK